MAELDTVHEKLDIKILILFVLRRLPDACDAETLAKLVLSDAGIGYFEFAECLSELIDSQNVEKKNNSYYKITEKGEKNCAIVESSLPYTVRNRLIKVLNPLAADMKRRGLIRTAHSESDNGCYVELSVQDDSGMIMEMRLLCSGDSQAEAMEERFRKNAEQLYTDIMKMLTD